MKELSNWKINLEEKVIFKRMLQQYVKDLNLLFYNIIAKIKYMINL